MKKKMQKLRNQNKMDLLKPDLMFLETRMMNTKFKLKIGLKNGIFGDQIIIEVNILSRCNFIILLIFIMGNNVCCASDRDKGNQLVLEDYKQLAQVPTLNEPVQQYLDSQKPFHKEISQVSKNDAVIRQYGDDIYNGPVNIFNKPSGYGKLIKKDGSVYIGEFNNGIQKGIIHYVLPDGSHYIGEAKNGVADSNQAKYTTTDGYQYEGSIKNNQLHGHGKETGAGYVFQGQFENGKRKKGRLVWGKGSEDSSYEGQFDQNGQFTGKGVLRQPQGVYEGQFSNGKKHGEGKYTYAHGGMFEGYYANNIKLKGRIENSDGTLFYEGQFLNGLPNGKGKARNVQGMIVQADFYNGVPVQGNPSKILWADTK